MKKLALLMALLMLGSFSAPAKALTITEKEMGYISVNTSASKEMSPDTARVSFSVETTAKTSKAASDQNKEITNKLIGALKPLIEIDKKDTIQTSNLNLRPDYSYDKNAVTFVRGKWSGDPNSEELLKALKITIRCIPFDQSGSKGECLLTGAKDATVDVIYARSY